MKPIKIYYKIKIKIFKKKYAPILMKLSHYHQKNVYNYSLTKEESKKAMELKLCGYLNKEYYKYIEE